ncbi:MAG: twin-arginine translocation signal domain-containing protein, partial [Planctomycetia bacterium]
MASFSRSSRRSFVQAGAATAAALAAGNRAAFGADAAIDPVVKEKLRLAIIGCGNRGAANLASVADEEIVALCDVSQPAVDAAAKRF